jgi:hypothetical protein
MNFAIGFFGYPFDGQYQQSITIEADGVRSSSVIFVVHTLTFLPYHISVQQHPCPLQDVRSMCILEFDPTDHPFTLSCPNAGISAKSGRGLWYIERWANIYLKDARKRLKKQLHGLDLSIQDVYTMQQLCPYEVLRILFAFLISKTQFITLDRGTWILQVL